MSAIVLSSTAACSAARTFSLRSWRIVSRTWVTWASSSATELFATRRERRGQRRRDALRKQREEHGGIDLGLRRQLVRQHEAGHVGHRHAGSLADHLQLGRTAVVSNRVQGRVVEPRRDRRRSARRTASRRDTHRPR